MKNLDNVSDLIIAYIDGDIDSTSETILFNHLAAESELRNELREHISIRTIVQEDSVLLLPPDRLREQVMASAGIVDPALGRRPWYRDAIRLPLLAALTATLVTLWLMWPSAPPKPTTTSFKALERPSVVHGVHGSLQPAESQPKGGNSLPPLASSRAQARGALRTDRSQSLRREERVPSVGRPRLPESIVELPPISPVAPRGDRSTMIPRSSLASTTTSSLKSRPSPLEISFGSADNQGSLNNDISPVEHRFSAELRGGIEGSFPSVEIAPSSRRLSDGLGASLFYRLDGENALGIGVGIRDIGQEYQGVEGGATVHYRQNPSLVWVGAHYRRTFNMEWFGGHLRPFVGGVAGGTTLGPAGSIETGLLFTPDERTSFLAGVDGSLFSYRFQGQWFSSRTVGAVYGVSLTF